MAAKNAGGAAASTSRASRAAKVDTTKVSLSDKPGTADTEGLSQDKLTGAAAQDMDASGAFQEPEIKDRIDVDHPAVDNKPREGVRKVDNQIDFNDPTKTDEQAVADNLKAQGAK